MSRLAGVLALVLIGAGCASAPAGGAETAYDGGAARTAAPTLAGCPVLPDDNYWNTPVTGLPVHPRSAAWLARMSTEVDLHPDFGTTTGGPNSGIPITVVTSAHPRRRVRFGYASESDRVRYPLGRDTRIEGGRASDGDRHAIVVDRTRCRLYETFATRKVAGRWRAGSGAVWSLRSHALRPDGWTSADAAGLPILPGLLRWKEVKSGEVRHAIRFTTDMTSRHHLWPARHDAGSQSSLDFPPMGARFRLDPDWQPAGFGPEARAVVTAMKTYGLVLADNGSPWFFQGEQSRKWPNRMIEELKTIPASAFEAVDTAPLEVSPDSGQARQP